MLIPHPLLGLRDAQEFSYLGDVSLLDRPDGMAENAADAFFRYVYLRDNPAGVHRELWFHEQGDRSWLVVTRNTVTHEILGAELARDVALRNRTPRDGGDAA
ncbi:MAG: sarcosine oxidase subunit delta [Mesorhizobium sp.]|uniref:sarcosine oxidase subunit delta n=1 Tax=Mesorhizobium sp. TaxID=1871066 RepID=UPI000FE8E0E1|nr:sarcosine oxidase subunit delta [Mesorhizobium sp.]RWB95809.1 MAG: sarcosine oxidase subunit delta [Mesorhizobium sp.]RWE10918.1 MAG: sarcosine oxidase subunit delta [Mesorhizobium sp.]TIS45434.1 MAG: sarcosine oxidase subunit delta [Mesorhizobium sp.]